jgi:hypothetical protein
MPSRGGAAEMHFISHAQEIAKVPEIHQFMLLCISIMPYYILDAT